MITKAEAIKRLKDCSCSSYMRVAIDMGIDALEHESQWVSVDDRMPQSDGFYLVKVGAEYRPIRVFEYKPNNDIVFPEHQNLWIADSGTRCFNWFVTHWMPLPESPKEEQE